MTQVFQVGKNRLSTPVGRWASVGPYYAMFPISFAFAMVDEHCPPGGAVLDPFVGRGSSIYAAVSTGRYGCGIEINEVGWLYSHAKLNPAPEVEVLQRNQEISHKSRGIRKSHINELPEFFRHCYTPTVLRYLLAARDNLNWKSSSVDATLMAIILVYLHGAKEKSLSNQMRQGKAMAPDYSITWWREHHLTPPNRQPMHFMAQRIRWRYAKGIPNLHDGSAYLGDSTQKLDDLRTEVEANRVPRFDLLFTSPPYYNITSYHYDQWLRLWMLGHEPRPSKTGGEWQNGFWSQTDYRSLLETVFSKCALVLKPEARIVVRTDAREFTLRVTKEVLAKAFPDKHPPVDEARPLFKPSQTSLYGDKSKKPGEIDLILLPR
ncbi:MAG: site-specific DNA-methyltransferase [Chloroflexi bacterium]|nr:site-specific DNA-methyltransferase [Chloroflexota bacterium]